MPSPDEYGEALAQIANHIEGIENTILEEIDEENEDGISVDGYVCEHGNNVYNVFSMENWELFRIQFQYSMVNDRIAQLSSDDSEGQNALERVEVSEEVVNSATEQVNQLLGNLSDEQADKVRFKLIQMISNPGTSYQVLPPQGVRAHGFQVEKKIFPYVNSYDISRYEEAVQSTMGLGVPARLFLRRAFNFGGDLDSGTQTTTDEPPTDPTYQ